jgi:hypothetical protein
LLMQQRLNRYRQAAKRVREVYISTANRRLAALFFVILLVLIAHHIRSAGLDEPSKWPSELWGLFYELCLALAASYIFYFVVVHVPRQHDKEIFRPSLEQHTDNLIEDAKEISERLMKATEHNFEGDFPPTLKDTVCMCNKVEPLIVVPGLFIVRWHEFLAFRSRRTKDSIARIHQIYAMTPLSDPKHLQRVIDLDTCLYFSRLDVFIENRKDHSDLGILANELHEYFNKAKRLKEYADSNLSR